MSQKQTIIENKQLRKEEIVSQTKACNAIDICQGQSIGWLIEALWEDLEGKKTNMSGKTKRD